ncbi:hypothetical protein SAMN02799616_03032 [Paenibacillus sp. UNC499MF]|nr:hypothetical protein SAMN02799616_03032 [Paenibacillus sp. UNC499MF]
MKKMVTIAGLLIVLIAGYLYANRTYSFKMSEEGFPLPASAVFKNKIIRSEGNIYLYTWPGLHQTDGLPGSYRRHLEKQGWNYLRDQSEGASFIFAKSDGTVLNVSVYEEELSIFQSRL